MAMKPDGTWEAEDDSVANNVDKLTSQDSALMTGARTQGLQQANKRGLLNSSVAVQAAQKAGYDAAIPIATADANITNNKNITGMNNNNSLTLQSRDAAAAKERLGLQLTSEEKRASQELASREKITGMTNENALLIQQRDALAAKERLGIQLTSEEKRLQQELANRTSIAAADRTANQQNTQAQIASTDRRAAMDTVAAFEAAYSNALTGIMANDKIPAATRSQVLQSIQASRQSNIQMVEQMYGVDLAWATSGGGTTSPTTTNPALQAILNGGIRWF